ncbi:MAG: lasso peptide biosynthesis B2 protein [Bacteroidetes bacterium]|nr:MAG: lasso peptide biosynthesis B2 protein [Bacteroidota bacterium]
MIVHRLLTSLRNFIFRWSLSEKTLFLEAVTTQLGVKLFLLIIPFKSCLRWFPPAQEETRNSSQDEVLKAIRKAVRRSGKLVSWKNQCLVLGFTARIMLKRRGIHSSIILGANKNVAQWNMHAWVESRGIEITPMNGNFQALHRF